MVRTLTFRLTQACILLTLFGPNVVAQDSHKTVNRASVSATKSQSGFLDFALKGVNPSDRDYGQCLAEGRKFMFDETLTRGYFWSNVGALGLLGVFLIVIVHQQRVQRRHELTASELLTQYHNALARAEAQATEAIERNHAFMESMLALPEPNGTAEAAEVPGPKESPVKERKRPSNPGTGGVAAAVVAPSVAAARGDFPKAIAPSSVAKRPPAAALTTQAPDQIPAINSGPDLTAKINSLQQQLDAYKEEKKELLRQVSFAELRLQKEQQKNRSLKGE